MIDYSLLSFMVWLLGALATGLWAVWIARDKPSDYEDNHVKPGE